MENAIAKQLENIAANRLLMTFANIFEIITVNMFGIVYLLPVWKIISVNILEIVVAINLENGITKEQKWPPL